MLHINFFIKLIVQCVQEMANIQMSAKRNDRKKVAS